MVCPPPSSSVQCCQSYSGLRGSSQPKCLVPKQLPWVSEFLLPNGAFLASLHPSLPIFPPCLLVQGFNLSFLLLLNFLLVLLLFPWLVLCSVPSARSYFLICIDSPAASFVSLETFIPCMHMPSSRSSVLNGGSLASNTNPQVTVTGTASQNLQDRRLLTRELATAEKESLEN